MLGVARLDHQSQIGAFGADVGHHAIVRDFEDIAARLADDGGDAREPAGLVFDFYYNGKQTPFARQLTQDHVGKQPHIDAATREDNGNLAPAEHLGVGENRRIARRARALDNRLLDFEKMRHRAFDFVLANEKYIFNQSADDLAGKSARRFDRDAFGDGLSGARYVRALHRVIHGWVQRGLHAVNLDAG